MYIQSYVYRYTQGMQLDDRIIIHICIGKCCDQSQSAPRGKFCTYIIARQREELISLLSQYVLSLPTYVRMYNTYYTHLDTVPNRRY